MTWHEREETPRAVAREPEPEPAPEARGSMEWASALGDPAVARLARQAAGEEEKLAGEEGPEKEGADVEAAIEELAEDELPE